MNNMLLFFFCEEMSLMQIKFSLCPVYGSKCFTKSTIHVWCKKIHRSLHQAFRSLFTDGTKCLNKLGQYVDKVKQ